MAVKYHRFAYNKRITFIYQENYVPLEKTRYICVMQVVGLKLLCILTFNKSCLVHVLYQVVSCEKDRRSLCLKFVKCCVIMSSCFPRMTFYLYNITVCSLFGLVYYISCGLNLWRPNYFIKYPKRHISPHHFPAIIIHNLTNDECKIRHIAFFHELSVLELRIYLYQQQWLHSYSRCYCGRTNGGTNHGQDC